MENIESQLCKVASQVLNKDASQIEKHKSFVEQGGDALSAIFFAAQCRDAGLLVDVGDVSNHSKTLSDLAGALIESNPNLKSDEATKSEAMAFTELQHIYNTLGINRTALLNVNTPMSHDGALELLRLLVKRHPVLANHEHSQLPYESMEQCISAIEGNNTASPRSTQNGFNVSFFVDMSHVKIIGLVASTALLDAFSWHLMLQEIQSHLKQDLQLGPQLHAHTFAEWLDETEQKTKDDEEPETRPNEFDNAGPASHVIFTLDPEVTELLYGDQCHQALRTQVHDLVFASFAAASRDLSPGLNRFLEIRDGRPRDDSDAWSTVLGCFDELVDVPYSFNGHILDSSRHAKDARRRAVFTSVQNSSSRHNMVLNTTHLGQQMMADLLQPKINDARRKEIGHRVTSALGGVHIEAYWADKTLEFSIACDGNFGKGMNLELYAEKAVQILRDTIVELTNSSPRLTFSDFPHLPLMDYSSLDRMNEEKLERITENPLLNIDNIYPCSSVQENMLLGSSLDEAAYMCAFTVRVSTSGRFASCDAESWVAAWNMVVAKHSALRTICIESEARRGHFDQVVLKRLTPRVEISAGITPPQFKFGPLEAPHHLFIGSSSPGKFVLVLTISHVITDGHSAEVILSDMCGYVAGHNTTTGKVLSYSDYVLDQQQPSDKPSSDYWKDYLLKTQETNLPVTREKEESLQQFETVKYTMPLNVTSVDRLCQKHDIDLAKIGRAHV